MRMFNIEMIVPGGTMQCSGVHWPNGQYTICADSKPPAGRWNTSTFQTLEQLTAKASGQPEFLDGIGMQGQEVQPAPPPPPPPDVVTGG